MSNRTTEGRLRSLAGEGVRFLAAGIFSYGLGIGLSAFFREVVELRSEVSVALSLGVLLITNFLVARFWVFRASGRADAQFMLFAVTSVAMRGGEYVVFLFLLRVAGIHYIPALTIAMALSSGIKFFLFRFLIFRRLTPPAT